jgi:multisubunit Na+/H+ antiporter MnhB subunit
MDPPPVSNSSIDTQGTSSESLARAVPVAQAPNGMSDESMPPGAKQTIHWRSLSDAILFTLIIAGPTMLWEEMWRGQPMIDQKGDLWVVPTVIVVATYFVGGAIAGRHRRRPVGALIQGVALAVPTSLILVIADLARRLVLSKDIAIAIVGLWLAAIAGTVVIAVLGALFGRWLYVQGQRQKSLTREG